MIIALIGPAVLGAILKSSEAVLIDLNQGTRLW